MMMGPQQPGMPPMPGGAPGGMPGMPGANPYMSAQMPPSPMQKAGETAITQLLEMATSNPMLLMGLSMAGAAREISQLTGMSRKRGGNTPGQGRNAPAGAMPSASTMLQGNMGDMDRLTMLQTMLGGAPPPPGGGAMPGMPPGGPMPPMPGGPPMPGMPGMPPGGAPPMPMPPPGLPPQFAGLV